MNIITIMSMRNMTIAVIMTTTMSTSTIIITMNTTMNMNTSMNTSTAKPAPAVATTTIITIITHKFTEEGLRASLASLDDPNVCGMILRAKGIVPLTDGTWAHFDYVPGEVNVRRGTSEITGKICVIGSKLKEDALKKLFER